MSEYRSPYYDQPVLTVTPAGSKAIDERIAAAVEADRAEARREISIMQSETPEGYVMDEVAAALRAEVTRLQEALIRISALTPNRANARTATDLHHTVAAIADAALASAPAAPDSVIPSVERGGIWPHIPDAVVEPPTKTCPSCNGKGGHNYDTGGNFWFGTCDDCNGTGKNDASHE